MAEERELSDILQRAVQANAQFYKGLLELSLEYVRSISDIFGQSGAVAPEGDGLVDTGAGALVMEGEAGSTVSGAFLVTNDLGRNVSCDFVISELADPAGATLRAKAVFEPAQLALEPGTQQVVRVMIPVDDTLVAGVAYTGEIAIKGMDGFTIPVVLRRLHRVEDAPDTSGPADENAAAAKSGAQRPDGKKAVRKKAAGKKNAALAAKAGNKTSRRKKA